MNGSAGPRRQPHQEPGLAGDAMNAVREVERLVSETLKRVGYQRTVEQGGRSMPPPTGQQAAAPPSSFTPVLGNAADPAATLLTAMATALGTTATAMATVINDVAGVLTGSANAAPSGAGGDPGSVRPRPAPGIGLITANANRGSHATATIAVTNETVTVIPNVVLTVTDLAGENDHRIPHSAVRITPEFQTIGPGETLNYSISVAVTDQMEPGLYSGVIGTTDLADVQAVLQVRVNA